MVKVIAVALCTMLANSVSFAQTPAAIPSAPAAPSCATKAIDKNGKALAGATKTSFMKKCEADSGGPVATSGCADKAIGKDGKALAGAVKTSFIKKCEADAKAAK